MGYSVSDYNSMLSDSARMDAYVEGLRRAVRPDSVVLDIGTGTGVFAILAQRFGARTVYAIEPDEAIEVARAIARDNNCDQIEFLQALSTSVSLPEPATVMVSDLRGVLPIWERHLHSIIDARQRLLAPEAVLIPRSDTLWIAVAQAPELYLRHSGFKDFGIDLSAARRMAINHWRKGRVSPEQLLVEPLVWAHLEYQTIEQTNVTGQVRWDAKRAGTAHGLSAWFEADIAEGLSFSTGPASEETIYGTAFFPLQEPVTINLGDSISVAMSANFVGDDYVWRWETRVTSGGASSKVRADFKQSSFYGAPISASRLRKRADSYVPTITPDGETDNFVLSLMDGQTSQGDIARHLLERFPSRFAKWQDALTRVGEVSQKYSK